MIMTEIPPQAYLAALAAMQDRPKGLLKRAHLESEEYGGGDIDEQSLLAYLMNAGPNDTLRQQLGLQLARWDVAAQPSWTTETECSSERRSAEYTLLGLVEPDLTEWLSHYYPPADDGVIIITGDQWDPWYSQEKRQGRYYWDAYRHHLLEGKNWHLDAIKSLDRDTDRVVERVADPTRTRRSRRRAWSSVTCRAARPPTSPG